MYHVLYDLSFLYITLISNLLHMSAAFGFAPGGVTTSLGMYMIYFACSGCEFIFDAKTSKPVKASAYDVFQSLWRLLSVGFINTLFVSYLAHFDYMPFGRDRTHYLDPNHLGNCFCIARECIESLFELVLLLKITLPTNYLATAQSFSNK